MALKRFFTSRIQAIQNAKIKFVGWRKRRRAKSNSSVNGDRSKFVKIGIAIFLIGGVSILILKGFQHRKFNPFFFKPQPLQNNLMHPEAPSKKKSIFFSSDFFPKEKYEDRFPTKKITDFKELVFDESCKLPKDLNPQIKKWGELTFFEKLGRVASAVGTEHHL